MLRILLFLFLSVVRVTKRVNANMKAKSTTKSVAITLVEVKSIEEKSNSRAFLELFFLIYLYIHKRTNGKKPKLLIYGAIVW